MRTYNVGYAFFNIFDRMTEYREMEVTAVSKPIAQDIARKQLEIIGYKGWRITND
jgi:hypothetical protein